MAFGTENDDEWHFIRKQNPTYAELTHLSPEIVSIIKGVPVGMAEAGLSRAAIRASRQERLNAVTADFLRCPLPEVKAPTTPMYRLIRNGRVPDEAQPQAKAA